MSFPIIIVDDFYSNFNEVKDYAKSLNYYKKDKVTMPGLETKFIHEINNDFFNESTKKILSILYKNNNKIVYECRTKFCKITPYGNEYNKQGWIHFDDNNTLSALLYIQGDYDEGTSFYKKNKEILSLNYLEKNYLYNGVKINKDEYNKKLNEHNGQFKEILNVPLIENRLVIFDSSYFHKSNGYGNHAKNRIIQTFFFGKIEINSSIF
jgi:hypothetical protein